MGHYFQHDDIWMGVYDFGGVQCRSKCKSWERARSGTSKIGGVLGGH
ncbi:hypothetical protein Goklo_016292, partial [Gossypium klotzschianum]|nr:hypothetical protein [Gossypium klotzschianum]